MTRYLLKKRVYNTLIGRRYKLICKICNFPFKIISCPNCKSQNIDWVDKNLKEKVKCSNCELIIDACELDGCVESKPCKYRLWQCENCDMKYSRKQEKCLKCGGIVYTIGRKFYHCKCYENSFIDLNGEDDDGENI